MKRVFDFIVALVSLICLTPFFIIIGILIITDDTGPIFFKHRRVGKDGKLFMLYKFRSMKVKPLTENGVFEPGNISRVTSIGRFLRKTKLDELPQLINVLLGDMSLVGPRPEVEKWVAAYNDRWKTILSVKPGMTDEASIEFRDEESILSKSEDPEKTYREIILPKKLTLYEKYVRTNSFYGDLKLLYKTFSSIL